MRDSDRSDGNAISAASGPATEQGQFAKLLLEAGPLVVFFVANSNYGIFTATGVFMVATIISLVVSRLKFGRIPIMPLVSGFFVLTFGALTLYFHEEFFIKIKPTVVNLLFATILFGGLIAGSPLLRYLFGEVFRLQDRGWHLLTFRWACFFVFLAVLNEFIWRSFSTEFWAGFKLMGVMPITFVFALSQLGLLQRYAVPDAVPDAESAAAAPATAANDKTAPAARPANTQNTD